MAVWGGMCSESDGFGGGRVQNLTGSPANLFKS